MLYQEVFMFLHHLSIVFLSLHVYTCDNYNLIWCAMISLWYFQHYYYDTKFQAQTQTCGTVMLAGWWWSPMISLIDNLSVRAFSRNEMKFSPKKGGNLGNVITHNTILANQTTELFVCRWLRAHAKLLSHICWSLWHHFKHSVDSLIVMVLRWYWY